MSRLPKSELQRLKRMEQLSGCYLVGVDPASGSHTAVLYSPQRQPLTHALKVKNNLEGFKFLEGTLRNHTGVIDTSQVVFAIEASGERWRPLYHYFQQRGYGAVFVPPLFVKRTRELDDYTPRANDAKDTVRICNLAWEGRYFVEHTQAEVFDDLHQLIRTWEQVTDHLARTRQRIRSLLEKYFPEYLSVFSNVLGTASLEILSRWPFPEDVLAGCRETMVQTLRQASRKVFGEAKIAALLGVAAKSVGIGRGLKGARRRLKTLVGQAKFFKAQAREIMSEIRALLAKIDYAKRIQSIPGVALISTARFLAYLGDVYNFDRVDKIIDLAGLSLIATDSGNFRSGRQISRRGRKGLRRILYEIACRFIRYPNTARRKYLRARLQNKSHRQAVVAAIPHLVRTIFALVHGEQFYRPVEEQAPLYREIKELEARWAARQKQLRKVA